MQAMSSLDLGIDVARRFKYNHDSKLAELITFSLIRHPCPKGPQPPREILSTTQSFYLLCERDRLSRLREW